MQLDVHKTLYPFYTTNKMPHVTVTITKNASLAAIARYISYTTMYTVGYLQISTQGISFQVGIAMIFKEKSNGLPWFSTKTTNYDFIFT